MPSTKNKNQEKENKKTQKIPQTKNHQKSFIYDNFKKSIKNLKLIKSYFIFTVILFSILTLIGGFYPIFFTEEILKLIEELIKQTEGLGAIGLMRFIIFNNIKSAFFGLILGIFFGIIPLGIIIINGYVLGFVSNGAVTAEGPLVLWKLLPHGILEIPAIFISVALGLRLGMFLFIYRGKNKAQEFWKWIKDSLRIFIFIVIPLLLIAGIIEGLLISILN